MRASPEVTAARPAGLDVWERALVDVVPEGRENAIPWAEVGRRAEACIRAFLPELHWSRATTVRRCQEAAARLRRLSPPVHVVGLSGIGVFKAKTPDDLRFRAQQQWRRIRTQIEEARAFDSATVDLLLAAMGQLGLDIEEERAA